MTTCSSGHDNPDGVRFCGECGTPIAPQTAATSDGVRVSKGPAHALEAPKSKANRNLVILLVAIAVIGGVFFFDGRSADEEEPMTAAERARYDEVLAEISSAEVTFKVEGTAEGADLTLSDGTGNITQHSGKAVPLRNSTSGRSGISFTASRGNFVQLSAQNTGSSGTITCIIEVDGVVVDKATSSGGYVIASCSATV